MTYRNVKTGTVINVTCKITGENWEPVKAPSKKPVKKGTTKNE